MDKIVAIYVDGSFRNDTARWAYIVVVNDKAIYSNKGTLHGEINEMRQIGGELKATMEAIAYAKRNGLRCKIFYDYAGIFMWVADAFSFQRAWAPKNQWTQAYRAWVIKNKQFVVAFEKIKSHAGNRWNEAVDKLVSK